MCTIIIYLENAIQEFDRSRDVDGEIVNYKPIREFENVEILDLNDTLYLVAGRSKIYLLGQEAGDEWARLLTEQEILDLPIDMYWDGEETQFETSSKVTTELRKFMIVDNYSQSVLVFSIIRNMNLCQDPEWQSFPLFKIGAAIV